MQVGDTVEWDNKVQTIVLIADRNYFTPLMGVKQTGNIVRLKDENNVISEVYDFDLN